MIEQANESHRYGPDLLLMDEYLKLPKDQKIAYWHTMHREDQNRFIRNLFVKNLNGNVGREDELEAAERQRAK